MRLQDPLDDIFGSRIKVRILRLLFETRGMFSGREVSRLIRFSPTHTISNLRELETLGLVIRQRAGNTDLYQLDERNSAVGGVLTPVFRWEESLFEELAGMFVNKLGENLVSIRVFGSTARGEEKPDSDVDLLVTLDNGVDSAGLDEIMTEIDLEAGRHLGRPVCTIFVTESEYSKKVKGKQGFWRDIPRESNIIYEREGQEPDPSA